MWSSCRKRNTFPLFPFHPLSLFFFLQQKVPFCSFLGWIHHNKVSLNAADDCPRIFVSVYTRVSFFVLLTLFLTALSLLMDHSVWLVPFVTRTRGSTHLVMGSFRCADPCSALMAVIGNNSTAQVGWSVSRLMDRPNTRRKWKLKLREPDIALVRVVPKLTAKRYSKQRYLHNLHAAKFLDVVLANCLSKGFTVMDATYDDVTAFLYKSTA